ncbi:S8 family serine peptidase [Nonomuraea sp. NBC_01738]|uniref:S8 family serine peptidase n=1 Tax=Nonomuraea sp. NBC_01738 TaxID=2976003 RepID=UPI002E1545A2|nr:S8 family serine peptidase [Nonomuraea sp. NBC_01738]
MPEFEPPQVIVRFHSSVEVLDDPAAVLKKSDPPRWRRLIAENGAVTLRPVFTALEPARLRELQEHAVRRDPSYRAEPLDHFFYADAKRARDLESMAAALREWATVRSAEVEVIGPDPVVNAADDPRNINQDYLDAAPVGIDARYAWGFAGGDGAGQRIVDVERGWTFDHEDLVAHGITLINGAVLNTSRPHGTSVFGEMIASDNAVGCVGIAPNVASALASSYNTSSIPNAVIAAIARMDFGDVLLLEAQVSVTTGVPQYGPVETVEANYEAIRLATALGIIVVEAGGNGTNNGGTPAVDLDTYRNATGKLVLWRSPGNADFRDSGAILVAAASSAAPHTHQAYSTFGARIDCYAWGENVDTASSTVTGSTTSYTRSFNGTSSAAPIVAGAALVVQGVCQANRSFRLSPRQMRTVLGDPALNTPPAATETRSMGVLPNLRAIIDTELDVTPDVYLRDNLADTGEAHNGFISASPDVILRPAPVADPQAAYGEGSGTELSDTLGFEADFGQDNVIYVRVRNQGSTAAGATTATVFWSPPSTLVAPGLWTLVGTVTLPNVPAGEVLTVSGPLVWPAAQIPAPGHYCLVAIISTPGDPGPAPADFLNWANFATFIRANNNVTWRNFNVVDNDPAADSHVALPFLVAGAPDIARLFEVELLTRLPGDADVLLEVPLRFARDFRADLQIERVDEKRDLAIARLAAAGRVRFGPGLIGAGAVNRLRFLVRLNDLGQSGRIVARQLSGDDEVGRVSWVLAPGVRDRMQMAKKGDPIGALG